MHHPSEAAAAAAPLQAGAFRLQEQEQSACSSGEDSDDSRRSFLPRCVFLSFLFSSTGCNYYYFCRPSQGSEGGEGESGPRQQRLPLYLNPPPSWLGRARARACFPGGATAAAAAAAAASPSAGASPCEGGTEQRTRSGCLARRRLRSLLHSGAAGKAERDAWRGRDDAPRSGAVAPERQGGMAEAAAAAPGASRPSGKRRREEQQPRLLPPGGGPAAGE